MMETIWSKILQKLKRDGWHQGGSGVSEIDGSRCVGMALCWVAEGHYDFTSYLPQKVGSLYEEICKHLGLIPASGLVDLNQTVFRWNDAPERTFPDVENLLTELHEKELAEKGVL